MEDDQCRTSGSSSCGRERTNSFWIRTAILQGIFVTRTRGRVRDQLRPPAISIPSNIAEGRGRGSDADFRRFLFHAFGSANELEYDLLLARDLGFLPGPLHAERTDQVEEVRRLLAGLIERLGSRSRPMSP